MGMDATGAPSPMTAITVAQEGEYIALCFIPQGTTEMPDFSAQAAPPSGAPAASAAPQGPPHLLLGMKQEFTVTAAGSEIGRSRREPLPPPCRPSRRRPDTPAGPPPPDCTQLRAIASLTAGPPVAVGSGIELAHA